MLSGVILLGALILGLSSWGLGLAALLRRNMLWSTASLACCALSLLLACGYFYGGIQWHDWDSLLDTADAMLLSAGTLTAVSLVLVLAALLRGKRPAA